MPEDLSMGEISRTIHRIEKTLDGLDAKVDRIDEKVNRWREEVLAVNHQTTENTKDIGQLESHRKSDQTRQESRRWMVYLALVAAVLAFLSQFYFASRGA